MTKYVSFTELELGVYYAVANFNIGRKANFNIGRKANFNIGRKANFNIGRKANFNIGRKANFNIGRKANFNIGRKANFNIGQKANFNIGRKANFNIGRNASILTFEKLKMIPGRYTTKGCSLLNKKCLNFPQYKNKSAAQTRRNIINRRKKVKRR